MDAAEPARVVVLGASGLLGTALVPALRDAHLTVWTPTHAEVDIRDLEGLRALLREVRPSLIVNCAAQSRPDQAEQQPDEAFAVNAVGAHNVALAAREAESALMHISTDYVLDGTPRAPYTALENHLLRLRGLERLAPWREALAEHLRGLAASPTPID